MAKNIEIIEMASQFQQARILLSAIELGVFHALDRGPKDAGRLAVECKTDPRATRYLLDALASLGLVQKKQQIYSIKASLRRWLSPDSEETVLAMLQHSARLWNVWHCLTDVVRHGHPVSCSRSSQNPSDTDRVAFIEAMHVLGSHLAETVAKACAPARHASRLLDIGGASGTYTLAFLRHYQNLEASIFDLPEVILLAQKRVRGTRFAARVQYCPGDFYVDELPGGHDLALLSAIIHQNSREQNRTLFGKIHRALSEGGALLIRDYVMDRARTSPALGAVMAINMLVATESGGTYTRDEIRDDLSDAGFGKIRLLRRGKYMDSVMTARKL